MIRHNRIKFLAIFFFFFFASVAASPNFTQCLCECREGKFTDCGVDHHGRLVANPQDAVGLTYQACTHHCGSGQESFSWTVFSQQFSAWLLPWLALVSQLPFGAENSLDNLISGQFSPSVHQLLVLIIFSPSCPHCWVPHSGNILARPHSRQHPLGQRPVLGHQVPQPQERYQSSDLPPAGSTTSDHPQWSPRVPHCPS